MMRWWTRRKTAQTLPDSLYVEIAQQIHVLRHLSSADHSRLRALAGHFLAHKTFEGAHGLVVTDHMRVEVTLQACLLILNLDLSLYDDWQTIILYPGDFRVNREETDEDGVVHQWTEEISGESWEQGPVILSWDTAAILTDDVNIVLHEFAHKLDMRNGTANGCPPLRAEMSPQAWTQVFTKSFERFLLALERNEMPWLDEYAAHNPAEFFAVLSEMFFLQPARVMQDLPEAYQQLRQFYGQDPATARGNSNPQLR